VGCALAVTAVCLFLFSLYGHPLGGYASLNLRSSMWSLAHLPEGLAGNLFSPSRGVLVHLPWLLLAPLGLKRAPKPVRLLWLVSLGLVAVFLVLAGGYVKWWGGFSIGPRLQTESAAFATLLLVPALVGYATLAKGWRILLLALVGFSGATQLLGAYRDQASAWNEVVDPDRRPEKLWSVRDSQLVATWSPRWNISLEPYEPFPLNVRQRGPWIAVDLSGVANARYDGDPFVCAARSSKFPHYPRLDPQVVSRPGRFEFAPRGRPNAVTICRDAEEVQIPLPRVRAHALYGILAAGGASETESERIAATAVVRFTNGTAQIFPLRLNRNVFEYRAHLRHPSPPDFRVYAGRPDDPDALVWTAFRIHRRGRTLESLRLVRPAGTRLGVTLLALSVETDSAEPRGPGHQPAAP
jgi:hypothetical protein